MSVLYVIVFPLSDMNAGKAEAHSGHAAGAFTYAALKGKDSTLVNMTAHIKREAVAWTEETEQGFGTQVNLLAPNSDAMDMLQYKLHKAKHPDLFYDVIVDPTYPYVVESAIVPLIAEKVHTLPPQPLENGNFRCFREQATAMYVFDCSKDRAFRKFCDFNLKP